MQSITFGPFVAEVGTRIRSRRKSLGLSQEDLAREVGLSRVSISHIENGHRKQVKPETICRIATALSSSEEQLYGFDCSVSLSPSLRQALLRASSLPHPQQERLGRIIGQLLNWSEPEVISQ